MDLRCVFGFVFVWVLLHGVCLIGVCAALQRCGRASSSTSWCRQSLDAPRILWDPYASLRVNEFSFIIISTLSVVLLPLFSPPPTFRLTVVSVGFALSCPCSLFATSPWSTGQKWTSINFPWSCEILTILMAWEETCQCSRQVDVLNSQAPILRPPSTSKPFLRGSV
ncbi:hypothetical protein PLICRDRAFT_356713 [Plicaturopsis crispa FD-325 SS-3]|uniref:Uncharacterized protein n=1 Tax=Plicaturopsis crispa FD-325 SS-3 TaxID=944288 RepID=A0A0C9T5Q4_PLICR|nr:hypothetical protein PLICRDRAFT_356713 [Plicaturopsis crispa FD-325 SS-3]